MSVQHFYIGEQSHTHTDEFFIGTPRWDKAASEWDNAPELSSAGMFRVARYDDEVGSPQDCRVDPSCVEGEEGSDAHVLV